MSKWLKRLGLLVGSSCLLCTQTVSAFLWDDGGCGSWFSGSFEVGVETLYWKPTNGGFDYVFLSNGGGSVNGGSTVNSVETIKPDYAWGVRGVGRYTGQSGCNYTQLSGLWIRAVDAGRTNVGDNTIQLPWGMDATQPFRVFGKRELQYWNVDLQIGQFITKGCGGNFRAFATGRYSDFKDRQGIRVVNNFNQDGVAVQEARFHGVGPGVGVGGDYCVWNNLSLVGSAGFNALVGQRKTSIDFRNRSGSNVAQFSRLRFDRVWMISPNLTARLALSYAMNWSCFKFRGELGYEIDHYWNAVNTSSLGALAFSRHSRDVGFAGPFAGFYFSF